MRRTPKRRASIVNFATSTSASASGRDAIIPQLQASGTPPLPSSRSHHTTPKAATGRGHPPAALDTSSSSDPVAPETGCIAAVTRFLYHDTVDPADNLTTRLNKAFSGMCIIINTALVLVRALIWALQPPYQALDILEMAMFVVSAAVFWGLLFRMRATRLAYPLVLNLLFVQFAAALTVRMLAAPHFPVIVAGPCFAVVPIGLSLSWWPLHVVLFSAVTLCGCMNYVTSTTGHALLTISGQTLESTVRSRSLQVVTAMFFVIAVGCFVRALVVQFFELTRRADKSTDIATRISLALAQYDTDAAQAVVDDLRSTADHGVNEQLLASLETIVTHMSMYKPHLPNWVLPDASSPDNDEHGFTDEGDLSINDASGSHSFGVGGASASHRDRGAIDGEASMELDVSYGGVDTKRDLHHGVISNVAVAILHYDVVDPFTGAPLTDTSGCMGPLKEAMDDLSDAVHDAANDLRGAVHSFMNNQIVVTWNAAKRTFQAEHKAARFLARIRQHVARCNTIATAIAENSVSQLTEGSVGGSSRSPGDAAFQATLSQGVAAVCMNVCGVVSSGRTSSVLAGRRSQRVLASVAHFRPRLDALLAYARRYGAYVCDERTYEQARYDVVAQGIAVVHHGGSVFEVLQEQDVQSEEWMYAMKKAGSNVPHNLVTLAFRSCLDGAYQRALDVLDGMCSDNHAPSVKRLRERAQECLHDPNVAFASAV